MNQIDDGRRDLYIGKKDGAYIKVSQELLDDYKADYETFVNNPQLAALFVMGVAKQAFDQWSKEQEKTDVNDIREL